jgi:hypothetical protein
LLLRAAVKTKLKTGPTATAQVAGMMHHCRFLTGPLNEAEGAAVSLLAFIGSA